MTSQRRLDNHTFKYPNGNQRVNVAPGQTLDFGDIEAMSPGARGVSAVRETTGDDPATEEITEPSLYDGNILVSFTANADDVPDGYDDAVYTFEHNGTADDSWTDITGTQVQTTGDSPVPIPGRFTITSPVDSAFMVRVVATANDGSGGNNEPLVITSAPATVDAVDPSASGLEASRVVVADAADTLKATWNATTNATSQQRIALHVTVASLGDVDVWLNPGQIDSNARSWSLDVADDFEATNWTIVDGTTQVTVTAADLAIAISVRVDSRQGDTGEWTEGDRVIVGDK